MKLDRLKTVNLGPFSDSIGYIFLQSRLGALKVQFIYLYSKVGWIMWNMWSSFILEKKIGYPNYKSWALSLFKDSHKNPVNKKRQINKL